MKIWVRCRNGLVFFLLVVGFIAAPNSAFSNGTPGAQPPDAAQEQVLKLLSAPLPSQIKPQETPEFYKADSLYQYIDGGADVYLLYDFRVLLHQDFKSGAAELTADVYDMGRPEDAFGIYAAETISRYKFVPIGIEGYRSKGVLNFVQDRYYVKLAGMNGNADTLLDSFAQTVLATHWRKENGACFAHEAAGGKASAAFRTSTSRKDPLGHSFLAPAYLVAYAWGSQGRKAGDHSSGGPVRSEGATGSTRRSTSEKPESVRPLPIWVKAGSERRTALRDGSLRGRRDGI